MLAAGLVALGLTLALEPIIIRRLIARAILDVPNARSNHTAPTPRGGGIAVMIGLVGGVLVAGEPIAIGLLGGIAIAALVGGADDVRGVPVRHRLIATGIAALAIVWAIGGAALPAGPIAALAVGVAVIWTVGVVNAFNFMDGINGLSAATALVAGAAYAVVGARSGVEALAVLGVAIAAAGLGFAPYNVPRARVFLGDVGSYGLGAALAAAALLAVARGIRPEAAIAPLAIYLADTATTLVRRVLAGEVWHQAHKQHTYQRLVARGASHVSVSAAIGVLTAACAGLGLVASGAPLGLRIAADLALCGLLAAYLSSPRWLGPAAARP